MGKTRDVRKPPINEVMAQHLPQERGKCRWCGLPTAERTGHTKKLRWWHAECEAVVQYLTRPEILRDLVFARDQGVCANCGEDWSRAQRLVPAYYAQKWENVESRLDQYTLGPGGKRYVQLAFVHEWKNGRPTDGLIAKYPYVHLTGVSLWHVEHRVPLWKIAHMDAIERIKYFLLDAVETWCEPCHKHKSAKETAERAHYDRMGEDPVVSEAKLKGKKPWPKRKLQSRPMRKRRKSPKAKRTISRRR